MDLYLFLSAPAGENLPGEAVLTTGLAEQWPGMIDATLGIRSHDYTLTPSKRRPLEATYSAAANPSFVINLHGHRATSYASWNGSARGCPARR